MATITAQMVKELRERTDAGMMDCKAALTENNGEMEAAVDWLRKGAKATDRVETLLKVSGAWEHFEKGTVPDPSGPEPATPADAEPAPADAS